MSEFQERGSITVKVDRSPEVEKERAAKEEAQAKLKEFEQRALEERKAKLPEKFKDMVTSNETLTMAEKLAEQEKQFSKPQATGTVPISSQYTHQPKGYETAQDMYEDIKAKELAGDENAKKIIDAWFEKLIHNVRNEPLKISDRFNPQNEPLAKIYNRMYRRTLKVGGGN